MKHGRLIWCAGAVLAAVLTACPMSFAAENQGAAAGAGAGQPRQGRGPGQGQGAMTVQQRVDRMAETLSLKEDQKTKLKALFEKDAEKAKALRADTALDQEQRREKMRAMREESNAKVKEILTKEQYEKWQTTRQEMMGRGQGQRGGRGQGGGGAGGGGGGSSSGGGGGSTQK